MPGGKEVEEIIAQVLRPAISKSLVCKERRKGRRVQLSSDRGNKHILIIIIIIINKK